MADAADRAVAGGTRETEFPRVEKPEVGTFLPSGQPPFARARPVERLRTVAGFLFIISLTSWFLSNALRGTLREEFREFGQWGPPVISWISSLAIAFMAGQRTVAVRTVLRAGLVYEVVISYCVVFGVTYQGYWGATVADLTIDRVGLTWVVPWTLLFTVLVQAPLREALIALVASAAAPAVGYLVEMTAGRAPVLPPSTFVVLFVLPYAIGLCMTYIAARIVHELGMDVQRAQDLGSYRLVSLLGRGGMGEVWRATHHTLARPAAIKIIRTDALDSDAALARQAAVRFEREAQAIASLQSRHTVQLYDFGVTQAGTLFYVMELLDGMDLEEIVRRDGPMTAARAVHILLQACASLSEAHRRGVIHRDVKPANIYLCREAFDCDVVKILDFGLAKRIVPSHAAGSGTETRSDVITGTPAYLAPEAITAAHPVDGRADLYALGCVAYWLLAGRLLFESDTAMGTLAAHLERTPPAPSLAAPYPVPPALDAAVLQCLAKNPADRPPSADALAVRLREVALTAPWTSEDAAAWWDRVAPHPSA